MIPSRNFRNLSLATVVVYLQCSAAVVSNVTVKVNIAPCNPAPEFWYRVPEGYRDNGWSRRWRVLVIFGGRNCGGSNEVSNISGWADWADKNDVFLVAPGFKDDKYWEPQKWSGKALVDGLAEIRRRYPVCTEKILYYGYSAGSQASNLFATSSAARP